MPSLPILKTTAAPTEQTLLRYYHQLQSNWTAHSAESTPLDFGTAWTNPQLGRVHIANRMLDAALPEGMTAIQAMELAEAHYKEAGTTLWQWVMNPSAPPQETSPIVEHLMANGWTARPTDVMYLQHVQATAVNPSDQPLQIIPARASFKHAQALYEESFEHENEPQLVEAALAHLDDPHYDALIALREGVAVAHIGVLAMGEVGMIEQVFVSEAFRCKGIGTTMFTRALEICARSLFKHVLLGVAPDKAQAIRRYEKFGFRKIGQFTEYQRP